MEPLRHYLFGEGLTVKDAVRKVAEETGLPRAKCMIRRFSSKVTNNFPLIKHYVIFRNVFTGGSI